MIAKNDSAVESGLEKAGAVLDMKTAAVMFNQIVNLDLTHYCVNI